MKKKKHLHRYSVKNWFDLESRGNQTVTGFSPQKWCKCGKVKK